jgi:hypothetical protein
MVPEAGDCWGLDVCGKCHAECRGSVCRIMFSELGITQHENEPVKSGPTCSFYSKPPRGAAKANAQRELDWDYARWVCIGPNAHLQCRPFDKNVFASV